MQTSDSIVIIPTYNERENIENIIRAVFALEHGFHILVIEDGSPDGTAAIVKDLQREFPHRLFMVERKGKLGLGTAYIAGFKWALQRDYQYIFEMDADFSQSMAPRITETYRFGSPRYSITVGVICSSSRISWTTILFFGQSAPTVFYYAH